MKYKITVTVECEDEREITREYFYKPNGGINYQNEVESIINNLESEF